MGLNRVVQVVERLVILCSPHPAAYNDPTRFNSEQMGRRVIHSGLGLGLMGYGRHSWQRKTRFVFSVEASDS